jgi:hypothetical protein
MLIKEVNNDPKTRDFDDRGIVNNKISFNFSLLLSVVY